MYSDFICNYIQKKERDMRKNEEMKKENSEPGGRQGLKSNQKQGQAWATESES
jgi:hypothetical protein